MSRNHEVLAFKFDASTGEFFDTDEIIDAKRAPLSVMSPRGKKASSAALSYWWAHRAIPKARHGIEAKLVELGIADTYDLPFKSMGLSLSDQYWIKPYDSDVHWHDVNFFENDFIEAEVQDWMADVGLDFTGQHLRWRALKALGLPQRGAHAAQRRHSAGAGTL